MKGREKSVCRTMSVSMPEDVRVALQQFAHDDNRSVSSIVSGQMRQLLEREGYLGAGPRSRQTRLF